MKTYEQVILDAANRQFGVMMSGSNEQNTNADLIADIFEMDSDVVYHDIERKLEEVRAEYRAAYAEYEARYSK